MVNASLKRSVFKFGLIITLGIGIIIIQEAKAQREIFTGKGIWLLASVKHQSYQKGLYYKYELAQLKKMYMNMANFMELIHKTPILNPPKGYEIGLFATICEDGCISKFPISAASGMVIRAYKVHENGTVVRDEEGPSINVYFNDIIELLNHITTEDNGFYKEPKVINNINGFPVYAGGYLVLTKRSAPLFLPVTKGMLLQTQIQKKEAFIAQAKQEFSKGSVYGQWLKNKEANLKAMLEGNAYLAKTDPVKAEVQKKKIIRDMELMGSTLKAQESSALAQNDAYLATLEKELKKEQEQLNGLGTLEKNADATAEDGRRYVLPNKNFFNKVLTLDQIQLVAINLFRFEINRKSASEPTNALIKELQTTLNFKNLYNYLR